MLNSISELRKAIERVTQDLLHLTDMRKNTYKDYEEKIARDRVAQFDLDCEFEQKINAKRLTLEELDDQLIMMGMENIEDRTLSPIPNHTPASSDRTPSSAPKDITFGKILREVRLRAGFSQLELGRRTRPSSAYSEIVPCASISRIETGKRDAANLTGPEIEALEKALKGHMPSGALSTAWKVAIYNRSKRQK